VALVTFAGNSAVQCPLTLDYAYFRARLESAAPDSVTRGGTFIGDAISFAVQTAFDDVERGNKALVLLTDGGEQPTQAGDQHTEPLAAAATAWLRGIRLVTVGVGDPQRGALVPDSESDRTPFLYRGQPVETKLEENGLRKVAAANLGGAYLESGLDAGSVYRQLLAARGKAQTGNTAGETEFYPALLVCAIVLLALEMAMAERRTRAAIPIPAGILAATFALVALGFQDLPSGTTSHQPTASAPASASSAPFDVSELATGGSESFRLGDYSQAARNYALASDSAVRSPELLFDLANSLYRQKLYAEASTDFQRAADLSHDRRFRAQCKLAQANCAYRTSHGRDAFATAQALAEVLTQYREAWSEDPSLSDAAHNIEVVKRKIQELTGQLRSSARDFMMLAPGDVEREKHTAADDILREGQAAGKPAAGQRRSVDRDW